MTQKKKNIICIAVFVLCFAALLGVATVFDLDISHILTKTALAEHKYYTNDAFGAAFESFGTSPLYILLAVVTAILAFWCFKLQPIAKLVSKLGGCALTVVSAFLTYSVFHNIFGYIMRHLDMEDHYGDAWLTITVVFMSMLPFAAMMFAVNSLSIEQLKRLFLFCLASLFICLCASVIIEVVKIPVGRIRYRAMNMYPENSEYGFPAFQRWYQAKGQWIPKEQMRELFGTSDALKSFPSGHTSQAGCTYALCMLPALFNYKNKFLRAMCWILPIVFTGAVAVSRIVVGAHFFSDVLVGGTISFVSMIVARELFIVKGEKFFNGIQDKLIKSK